MARADFAQYLHQINQKKKQFCCCCFSLSSPVCKLCVLHFRLLEFPDPPKFCELRNDTIFEVVCTAGGDGGLAQYFLLEVVGGNPVSPDPNRSDFIDNNINHNEISTMNDQATTAPVRRMKEAQPEFKLFDLEPGREYQFLVYAVNAKGKSHPPVVMTGRSFNDVVGPHGKCVGAVGDALF